jgi:hypothetical protein
MPPRGARTSPAAGRRPAYPGCPEIAEGDTASGHSARASDQESEEREARRRQHRPGFARRLPPPAAGEGEGEDLDGRRLRVRPSACGSARGEQFSFVFSQKMILSCRSVSAVLH